MRIKVNIPEATSGDFRIEHVTTDSYCGSPEPMDTYTVLFNEHHNIMQDTTREYVEHEQFLKSVYGDILIAGLGLGMINQPLMDNPNVKSVTIIEKFQDVIDMVWDHCPKNKKFRLIHDDIYKWDIDSKFDIGWFDSWVGERPHEEYKKVMVEKYGPYCREIMFWNSQKDIDFENNVHGQIRFVLPKQVRGAISVTTHNNKEK